MTLGAFGLPFMICSKDGDMTKGLRGKRWALLLNSQ